MAINIVEYNLIRTMRRQNFLPLGADVLELGEANWYGDIEQTVLREDIAIFAAEDQRQSLLSRLDDAVKAQRPEILWEIAEVYWNTFLQPASMTAIDFHGTAKALKLDLNAPLDLKRQFHIVLNMGTLEHVFNVAQAFKNVHDHTMPGGFMIHGLPFTGWIDHGFFNFNPTFIWDLAAINNYYVCLLAYCELHPMRIVQIATREQILDMAKNGQIGQNTMLYAALRRPDAAQDFRIPMQGYYAGSISPEVARAWQALR